MKNENILLNPFTLQNVLDNIEFLPKDSNDVVAMGIIARDVKSLQDWGKNLPEKERKTFYDVLNGKNIEYDRNHPLLKAHRKLKLIKRAMKEGLVVTDRDIVLLPTDSDFIVSDDEMEFVIFLDDED